MMSGTRIEICKSDRGRLMKVEIPRTESLIVPSGRASSTQLRRAAGSQSLDKLKGAVMGWTVPEIDRMASEDGKSAIHMAAWQGCIENLQYLLDLGCNINLIATGKFSYGKTPIFFAATRCRNDVVEFLLQRGAFVKIVNNKGQSVLSIAASHLRETVVGMIQQCERDQMGEKWWNFRATHSDGLEYGDLDPRFLDRPVRESDVVTPLAINSTSAHSRRGAFLRRNPQVVRPAKADSQRRSPRKRDSVRRIMLTSEEQERQELAWARLVHGLQCGTPEQDDILTIITIAEKEKRSWVPDAVHRLRCSNVSPSVITSFLLSIEGSPREMALLQKIAYIMDDSRETLISRQPKIDNKATRYPLKELFSSPCWQEASNAVRGMSISSFEVEGPILSLPNSPVWVDSVEAFDDLIRALNSEKVLAIDTEWSRPENGTAKAVATLQVASKSGAWVIDGLQRDSTYTNKARQLACGLLGKILLGFAVRNDLPKLEAWLDVSLATARCLDLQLLWSGSQMPGLATCVAEFSSLPLSKQEQCSDWSQRPLRDSQLWYAALDAAILLPLLAEKTKQLENC